MGQKLRTLTNLISDLAVQARKGKRKYESESSDSRKKNKARTYVIINSAISSRNHDQAIEVSENISNTSVTKPCGVSDEEEENEDDTINIPDAPVLRQIKDLCQEGEGKGSTEGADDPILEIISQDLTAKEDIGSPLKMLNLQAS